MIICPYCGKQTFDDSMYCGWCGNQLKEYTPAKKEPQTMVVFQEPVKKTVPGAPEKEEGFTIDSFLPLKESLKDPMNPIAFSMPSAIAALVVSFLGNLVLFSGITRSLLVKITRALQEILGKMGMSVFGNTVKLYAEAGITERLLSAVIFTLTVYIILFVIIAVVRHSAGKQFVFKEVFAQAGSLVFIPSVLVLISAFLSFGLPTLCFFAAAFALVLLVCRIFTILPEEWNGWLRNGIPAICGFLIVLAGAGCLGLFWLSSLMDTIMRAARLFR